MAGTSIMTGYVHPHTYPHTQLKKSEILCTYTQSIRRFPVKTGTSSDNTHKDKFICQIRIINCSSLVAQTQVSGSTTFVWLSRKTF